MAKIPAPLRIQNYYFLTFLLDFGFWGGRGKKAYVHRHWQTPVGSAEIQFLNCSRFLRDFELRKWSKIAQKLIEDNIFFLTRHSLDTYWALVWFLHSCGLISRLVQKTKINHSQLGSKIDHSFGSESWSLVAWCKQWITLLIQKVYNLSRFGSKNWSLIWLRNWSRHHFWTTDGLLNRWSLEGKDNTDSSCSFLGVEVKDVKHWKLSRIYSGFIRGSAGQGRCVATIMIRKKPLLHPVWTTLEVISRPLLHPVWSRFGKYKNKKIKIVFLSFLKVLQLDQTGWRSGV